MAGIGRTTANFFRQMARKIKDKYPGAKNWTPLNDLNFIKDGKEQRRFFREWIHSLNVNGNIINENALNEYNDNRTKDHSVFNSVAVGKNADVESKLSSNDESAKAVKDSLNKIFAANYTPDAIAQINTKLQDVKSTLDVSNDNFNLLDTVQQLRSVKDEARKIITDQHAQEKQKLDAFFSDSSTDAQKNRTDVFGTQENKVRGEMKKALEDKHKSELADFDKSMSDTQNKIADIRSKEYDRLRFLGLLAKHSEIRKTIQEMNDPNLNANRGLVVNSDPGDKLDLKNIKVDDLQKALAAKDLNFITPTGTEMFSNGKGGYSLTLNRILNSRASRIENIQFMALAIKESGAKSIVTTIPSVPDITAEKQIELALDAVKANILGGPFPNGYTIKDAKGEEIFSYNPVTDEVKGNLHKKHPQEVQKLKDLHATVTTSTEDILNNPNTFANTNSPRP